ncbi:MAG: T9SS type A sorting domain-containing protein [Bacteroidetes bacterium]|jgi:GH35 family endo-1,4-beta-xylanase|nr:T9SS type A sorting domain-containing protein [Bacteroidota bacterium]
MKKLLIPFYLLLTTCVLHAQTWKSEADTEIAKHRKAPVKIQVTDTLGNPVEGAIVNLSMQKHLFKFGTVVRIDYIQDLQAIGYELGSDHPYYNHFKHFNSVTPGNSGKWKAWSDIQRRQVYEQFRNWLHSLNIDNRGHGTIWESTKFNAVPDFIIEETDTAVIRDSVENHIRQQLTALKDDIYALDLVNEPVHETYIVNNKLNVSSIAAERAMWHRWAKDVAPDLPLIINEFDLIQSGNNFDEDFVDYVETYRSLNGPVDGIGMQGHFFTEVPAYEELRSRIDEIRSLNLPVSLTEFDMESNQYDEMERILYAVFVDTLTDGFTVWGAWDGMQWRDNASIFYEDWTLKPSGKAWFDLVKGKWWTDTTLITNTSGTVDLNGFKGDYHAAIIYDGKSLTDTFSLHDNDTLTRAYDLKAVSNILPSYQIINEPESQYCVRDTVFFSIEAEDSDGNISTITYHVDESVTKTYTKSAATYEVSTLKPGKHIIWAEITDNKGAWVRTDTFHFTIREALLDNYFEIISPKNGQAVLENEPFQMGFSVNDMEAMVNEFSLLDGEGNLIYQENSFQENYQVQLAKGKYTLTARVKDTSACASSDQLDVFVVAKSNNQYQIFDKITTDIRDAEQEGNDMDYTGDIDIGEKFNALYFTQAFLPYGAIVDSAFVQFTSEKYEQTGPVDVNIYAELNAQSDPLNKKKLMSREKTIHAVNWMIPDWHAVANQTEKQKSPDVAMVLNELTSMDNWTMSSPLVLLIEPNGGNSKRSAYAYDQSADYAPELYIYYSYSPATSAPMLPTNLHIAENNFPNIKLGWKASASPEIAGYHIFVNDSLVNSDPHKDTTYTFSNILSISPDSVYQFQVSAINSFLKESERTDSLMLDQTTGIYNVKHNNAIRVFPNPAIEGVHIVSDDPVLTIKIFNLKGELIRQIDTSVNNQATQGHYISIADIVAGIYLMELTTREEVHTRKLIIP